MKIARNIVLFAIAIALGLSLGFAWRKNNQAISNDTHVDATATKLSSSSNRAPSSARGQSSENPKISRFDNSPLATALERDLSMSDGVTRWLYWLEAIEKAQLTDFPRLAQLAHSNPIALQLLAARWIDLNPRHLYDTLVAQNTPTERQPWASLGNTLFNEWIKRDAPAAIKALSETASAGGIRMRDWRWQVAGKLIETDPEVGVKLFHQWNIENFGPRTKGIATWAAKDPRHAAEVALEHPSGHATQLIMEEIGKQWAKIDPTEAMEFSTTRRDQFSPILAATALKTWAEQDLNGAAQWLVSTDATTRNRLSPPFVEAWGNKDPEAALDWCEANLTGSTLASSIGGLVRGAAQNDVRAAAELVNSLAPSAARAEGAVAVALKWMPEYGSRNAINPEFKSWLAQLDPTSLQRVLEDQVQWRWCENNPRDFADFLAGLDPKAVPDRTYAHVGRTLASREPEWTIEWANSLPTSAGLNAGTEAFSTWYESQPANATRWLDALPPADPRRDRYFETMVRNIAFNAHAAERLSALPEHHRRAARDIVEKLPLGPDHRAQVLAAFKE